MKKSGKAFLLTSGILETIYASFALLGSLLILGLSFISLDLAALDSFGIAGAATAILVAIGLLVMAVGILLLVFGILSIRTSTKEPNSYYAAKGKILVFAIIESILLVLMLIGTLTGGVMKDTTSIVATVIVLVVFALVVAFKYVAFAMMAKHSKSQK